MAIEGNREHIFRTQCNAHQAHVAGVLMWSPVSMDCLGAIEGHDYQNSRLKLSSRFWLLSNHNFLQVRRFAWWSPTEGALCAPMFAHSRCLQLQPNFYFCQSELFNPWPVFSHTVTYVCLKRCYLPSKHFSLRDSHLFLLTQLTTWVTDNCSAVHMYQCWVRFFVC